MYLLVQTPVTKNKIYDRHQSIQPTDGPIICINIILTHIITTSVLQQEQKQEKQQKNKNTYNFIIIVANLLKDLIHLYKWLPVSLMICIIYVDMCVIIIITTLHNE